MSRPWYGRAARAVLRRAVRGRGGRGDEWGEAMLAELDEVPGWAAVPWAVSAARLVLCQRWVPTGVWAALRGSVRRDRRVRLGLAALVGALLSLTASQAVAFAYVPSGAMAPTLNIGDRLLVDEVSFRVSGLRHGDLVLYDQAGETFSKRVLGLPGDRIRCAGGAVYRNGARVVEPYLAGGTVTQCAPVTVPAGTMYVLGDSREVSADSRQYGVVPLDAVTGRVLTRFRLPFGTNP